MDMESQKILFALSTPMEIPMNAVYLRIHHPKCI